MRPALFSSPLSSEIQPEPKGDSRVSERSKFSDDTWDFSVEVDDPSMTLAHKQIEWKFDLDDTRHSLLPEYASFINSMKELAYLMLFGPEQYKHPTVVSKIMKLKVFVRFLANRPFQVFRFQDVLQADMKEYLVYLDTRPGVRGRITPSAKTHHLNALNHLYDSKEYLSDHLLFRPTGNKSPDQVAGHKAEITLQNRTKPIPDEQLKAIVGAALDYVLNRADVILACLEEFVAFLEKETLTKKREAIRYYAYDRHFFEGRSDFQSSASLNAELVLLRAACFIVVAFSTGMRLSEILAMTRGCIRREKTANHGDFYWIDSKLYKTQKVASGSARAWMCGPLAARAVDVLERKSVILKAKTPHIFLTVGSFVTVFKAEALNLRVINRYTALYDLKRFCASVGVKTDIHPHRFRRSFARNIIRYTSTPIPALRDHFHHWSIYMTDWYIGLDPELIEELEAERELLSMEAAEKICTQPVSGAGGRRWSRELEERIKDGRLPKNFKGKAGYEFRRKMITGLHASGMIVIPCGDFTNCIFQKDRALCTEGDYPVPNKCNAPDCPNSYILEENVPAHRKKLAKLEELYNDLSEAEKAGPAGLLYMRGITKQRRVLEPFEGK
jgi:integrase